MNIKNYITAIIFANLILLSSVSFSQSNYERGFKTGYTNGYCFDLTTDCRVAIPEIKIKSGNYQNGYDVGFERALKERKDINHKTYNKDFINISEAVKRQYPIRNAK